MGGDEGSSSNSSNINRHLPGLNLAVIYLISQILALVILAVQIYPEEYRAFQNPNDPMDSIFYITFLLIFTGIILLVIKFGLDRLIKAIFMGSIGITIVYVIYPILFYIYPPLDLIFFVASIGTAAFLVYRLYVGPEWYLLDIVGVLVAVGVIAILGMSLGILPALVLLIGLAIYDAISVYKTKHMIDLAEGVTSMNLPVLLVMPRKKGYKLADGIDVRKKVDSGEERDAMLMGLGDVIIPGILVASAYVNLPANGLSSLWVALGTMVGGLLGYMALMHFVNKGNPQAGLPLLNGGSILGYVLTYILIYQNLNLGIVLNW